MIVEVTWLILGEGTSGGILKECCCSSTPHEIIRLLARVILIVLRSFATVVSLVGVNSLFFPLAAVEGRPIMVILVNSLPEARCSSSRRSGSMVVPT